MAQMNVYLCIYHCRLLTKSVGEFNTRRGPPLGISAKVGGAKEISGAKSPTI